MLYEKQKQYELIEIEIGKLFNHPFLVKIHHDLLDKVGNGEKRGIIMDWCDGGNLHELIV